jgi:hypothetical protein
MGSKINKKLIEKIQHRGRNFPEIMAFRTTRKARNFIIANNINVRLLVMESLKEIGFK